MATSGDPVQEIKQRVDLVDVVSEYVKLRPAGKRHVGLCPFHGEKTPSFSVSQDQQAWYCFGCSEGGDLFSFVQKIENLTFREALERLAKRAGVELPDKGSGASSSERERLRGLHELACRFYEKTLSQTPNALKYLQERGISPEAIRTFRIGYAPDSWDALRSHLRREHTSDDDLVNAGLLKRRDGDTRGGYDAFRDRIIFPIGDIEGRVIAFGGRIMESVEGQPKYLNSPETLIFSKKSTLYALHRALPAIKEKREALVMEGYMDVIAAHEHGFNTAVAPLGTAFTSDHLHALKRFCDRVLLVFDADSAGLRAALRSLALFERTEIEARVVVLPSGEDPDSLLRKCGAAPFAQALTEARPILDYRMESILNQHDVRSDEGFNRAMGEIAPLLAQVTSNNTWIHRLAEIRSEGAPERVAFWEEDVRRRLQHSRGRTPEESAPFRSSGETGKSPDEGPKVSSAIKKLYLIEEGILQACLADAKIAGHMLAQVPPNMYLRSETRELATLINAHSGNGEWKPGSWIVDSEAVGTLIARLSTSPTPLQPLTELEKSGEQLKLHHEKKQVNPLTEGRIPTTEEWLKIKEHHLRKKKIGQG